MVDYVDRLSPMDRRRGQITMIFIYLLYFIYLYYSDDVWVCIGHTNDAKACLSLAKRICPPLRTFLLAWATVIAYVAHFTTSNSSYRPEICNTYKIAGFFAGELLRLDAISLSHPKYLEWIYLGLYCFSRFHLFTILFTIGSSYFLDPPSLARRRQTALKSGNQQAERERGGEKKIEGFEEVEQSKRACKRRSTRTGKRRVSQSICVSR